MTEPIPAGRERPIALRGAFLLMGFVVAFTAVQRWFGSEMPDGGRPPIALLLVPLLLAISMGLQFFAKRKDSPLLAVSIGLVAIALVGLLGLSQGWFGG